MLSGKKNIPVTDDENMHIIIILSVKINWGKKNIPVTNDENMHIFIIVSVKKILRENT